MLSNNLKKLSVKMSSSANLSKFINMKQFNVISKYKIMASKLRILGNTTIFNRNNFYGSGPASISGTSLVRRFATLDQEKLKKRMAKRQKWLEPCKEDLDNLKPSAYDNLPHTEMMKHAVNTQQIITNTLNNTWQLWEWIADRATAYKDNQERYDLYEHIMYQDFFGYRINMPLLEEDSYLEPYTCKHLTSLHYNVFMADSYQRFQKFAAFFDLCMWQLGNVDFHMHGEFYTIPRLMRDCKHDMIQLLCELHKVTDGLGLSKKSPSLMHPDVRYKDIPEDYKKVEDEMLRAGDLKNPSFRADVSFRRRSKAVYRFWAFFRQYREALQYTYVALNYLMAKHDLYDGTVTVAGY